MSFFSVASASKSQKNGRRFKKKTDESGPIISTPSLIMLLVYLAWIAGGTCWYALIEPDDPDPTYERLGWFKGLFMAVNIGYSIGYGYPAETSFPKSYLWFSVIYVLIGASFVSVALGKFADRIIEDTDNWFTNLLQRQEYESNISKDKPLTTRVYAFVSFHREVFRTFAMFLVWIGLMVLYAMINAKYAFVEALYFAISSCSTGGHWSLPDDTQPWLFGVTGLFNMIGCPLMAIALASLASLTIERGDMEEIKSSIAEDVTAEELIMLQKFGLENGDGVIDKAEFIILCMVRLGTDPRTIEYVSERFNELDKDRGGTLSIQEISGGRLNGFDLKDAGKEVSNARPTELLKTMKKGSDHSLLEYGTKKKRPKKPNTEEDDDDDDGGPKRKSEVPKSQTEPLMKTTGYGFPHALMSSPTLTAGESEAESTESNTWV